MKINSLATHNSTKVTTYLFRTKDGEPNWDHATIIAGETAMGYSEAMIINMANCTTIQYILTFDRDLIYGGHISGVDKIMITVDGTLKQFKLPLKGI